jgi:hypothetical protein
MSFRAHLLLPSYIYYVPEGGEWREVKLRNKYIMYLVPLPPPIQPFMQKSLEINSYMLKYSFKKKKSTAI